MDLIRLFEDGLEQLWQTFGAQQGGVLVPVVYVRIARDPYQPGGRVVNTTTLHPIPRVALLDYDLTMNPRTDIQVSDKQCIIRAKHITFRPSLSDRIREADGTEWNVVGLSGDVRLYHDLQLRKR